MPRQIIELPIVGGVDEKTDERLGVQLTSAINLRYAKHRSLSKRFGFNAITNTNNDSDGNAIPTTQVLTTRAGELVRLGRVSTGALHTVIDRTSSSAGVKRDEYSPFTARRNALAASQLGTKDPDCATLTYNSVKYGVFVYAETTSTTRANVILEVLDLATGARLQSRLIANDAAAFATGQTANPKVIAVSTTRCVVTCAITTGASAGLYGRVWDITTNDWASGWILLGAAASPNASRYDICACGTNAWVVFYEDTLNNLRYELFDHTMLGLGLSGTWAIGGTAIYCCAVGSSGGITASDALYFVWANDDTVKSIVGARQVTPSSGATISTSTVYTGAVIEAIPQVAVLPFGNAFCIYSWFRSDPYLAIANINDTYFAWQKVTTSSGATVYATARYAHFTPLSKPAYVNGAMTVVAANGSTNSGGLKAFPATGFLLALNIDDTDGGHFAAQWQATFAPRQLVPKSSGTAAGRSSSSLSNLVFYDATGKYVACVPVSSSEGPFTRIQTEYVEFRNGLDNPATAEINGLLLISGGVPCFYDGDIVFEAGFAYEPPWPDFHKSLGGGGGLTATKTYGFRLVFEHFDALGNVHYSTPSLALSQAMGANTRMTFLYSPTMPITRRTKYPFTQRHIVRRWYRTLADAGEYYVERTSLPTATDLNDVTVHGVGSMIVDSGDTTVASNRKLYTEGGVLSNATPPSASIVLSHQGRFVLAGTDDDSIWFSKRVTYGEGPGFNPSLTIAPFDNGRVTALGSLDDKLVIFKERAAYIIYGQGPDDRGFNSDWTEPKLLSSDVGCINQASVVTTSLGLMFQAAKGGIYLLTRDLRMVAVGKAVETTLGSNTVCAAYLEPQALEVRFLLRDTATVLVLDLLRSTPEAPVWLTDTYWDAQSNTAAVIKAGCYYNGKATWINSTGTIYQEDTSHWLDKSYGGGSSYWAPSSFELAFEKAAGAQGWHRVKRFGLLYDRKTAHGLTVSLGYDYATTYSQVHTFSEQDITNNTDKVLHVDPVVQKLTSFRVKVADSAPASLGTGRGSVFQSVAIEVDGKPGLRRAHGVSKR